MYILAKHSTVKFHKILEAYHLLDFRSISPTGSAWFWLERSWLETFLLETIMCTPSGGLLMTLLAMQRLYWAPLTVRNLILRNQSIWSAVFLRKGIKRKTRTYCFLAQHWSWRNGIGSWWRPGSRSPHDCRLDRGSNIENEELWPPAARQLS